MIATRSAIFGVSRYGWLTRGSGGRKRGTRPEPLRGPLLAKRRRSFPSRHADPEREQATRHRVHRQRQDQVERDALEQRVEQDQPGGGRLAENEPQRQAA